MMYMLQCNSKAGNPENGWIFIGLCSPNDGEALMISYGNHCPEFSFRLIPLAEG